MFINCPFDSDFRPLLVPLIFVTKYFGYIPKLALESADSGTNRIAKIVNLIKISKFGIHDLSRIVSSEKEELYRMNMPFELGIDYGCQKLKGGKYKNKKILILEKEQYRLQKALSDLSGSDIKSHNDEPIKIIVAVRDWLITEELSEGDSGEKVWNNYNDFQTYLYEKLVVNDGHKKVSDATFTEVIHLMTCWFEK